MAILMTPIITYTEQQLCLLNFKHQYYIPYHTSTRHTNLTQPKPNPLLSPKISVDFLTLTQPLLKVTLEKSDPLFIVVKVT